QKRGHRAPADFAPDAETSLRRLVLIELVKIDLEQRWSRNLPKRIEEYRDEFPELAALGGLPVDLIYEEFFVRKQAGEEVHPTEFLNRFPDNARELARLLNVDSKLLRSP